jgi:hypothetical protein
MRVCGSMISTTQSNPLDIVEEIASAYDWAFDRTGPNQILIEATGRWSRYGLWLTWEPALQALQLSCSFDLKPQRRRKAQILELLSVVNERVWCGHFEHVTTEEAIGFRYSLLLRGSGGASVEQLEDLVECSVTEIERFYPAFQLVLWGGKDAQEAVATSVFDTVGEA